MPNYKLAARRAALKAGIDPAIFEAQIAAESGFNPRARSGAGAQGIAQFMPATAKAYGVNLNDGRVTDDLEGAARMDAASLKQTGGNWHEALSLYNSGRAQGYKSIPETRNYVAEILRNAGGYKSAPVSPSGTSGQSGGTSRTVTSTATQGPSEDARRQVLAQWLINDGSSLSSLANQLSSLPSTTLKTIRTTSTAAGSAGQTDSSGITAAAMKRANSLNAKHLPYRWGGGHGSKLPAGSAQPVDCSGAVSEVLGINPRVASEFEHFGSPGAAPGGKGITIYAKSTHVIMEIDGHFFGTSASNPGGGAGWIPRSQLSGDYLKGFTARHLAHS